MTDAAAVASVMEGLDKLKCGADPGKGALLVVTDGKRNTVRYTARLRRMESGQLRAAQELDSVLKKRPRHKAAAELAGGPLEGLTFHQLQQRLGEVDDGDDGSTDEDTDVVVATGGRDARSSLLASYSSYLVARQHVGPPLRNLYTSLGFRRRRFRAFAGRQSSLLLFVNRMVEAFGPDFILIYGDWGRQPNMRNQAPTPGIGLRRDIERAGIRTLTASERNTSSVCPCCSLRDLEHPRRRYDPKRHRMEPIHHLLRCPNEQHCTSRWWNRDVLGALNILKMGVHAMETGAWHPDFA